MILIIMIVLGSLHGLLLAERGRALERARLHHCGRAHIAKLFYERAVQANDSNIRNTNINNNNNNNNNNDTTLMNIFILLIISSMYHRKAQQYAQKRVRAHNAPHLQTTMSQIWLHILGWGYELCESSVVREYRC